MDRDCSASTNEEVIDILRQRNLNRYVDDYHSYLEIRDRISDGNEKSGFILQSLQSWARFVIDFLEKKTFPMLGSGLIATAALS